MLRYEQTRDDLVARLRSLEGIFGEERAAATRTIRRRLARSKFVLAVVGEFSSGKSFLLNALLGKFRYEDAPGGAKRLVGLLATDINPSTATITELEYGESDEANALFEDGRKERIPLDRLNRFIAVGSGDAGTGTIHDATKDEQDAPTRVLVQTNSPFLARGFVVADTPGLASINPAHRRATLQFLPSADAVLYLIDTQQPFSEGDASFLGIIRQHIDSIFIVQTKIDLWEQTGSDGKPAWEHAYDRIANLAAVHAPGTYVYALSARAYVDGLLEDKAQEIEASRFPKFLAALDASLIRSTGRARLRRAREQVQHIIGEAVAQRERDERMLALDQPSLMAARDSLLPHLQQTDDAVKSERERLRQDAVTARKSIDQYSAEFATELQRTLAQAFDAADVAKLRDRARLHILVDRVFASVVDEFAGRIVHEVVDCLNQSLERSASILPARISLNDAAARAFDADPGMSLWSGDVSHALAATIVLDAIGGPAIGLVHDIASRFAAARAGAYMKRELTADLRAEIFPRFSMDVLAFAARMAAKLGRMFDLVSEELGAAAVRKRDEELGSIDRALAAHTAGTRETTLHNTVAQREQLLASSAEIDRVVETFMGREEEIAPADPGHETIRASHIDASFDPNAYDRGLRPSRWRVAVLGALRRGKSSLINAIAGKIVLTDEGAGSARFPIHVRYGERETAFSLAANGEWREIAFETASAEAANSPVLVLLPWKLPRELVLVHAPAFDAGDDTGEDVNVVVASHASEVLCLFSRQLSDRELELYERVAEFGKPMLFGHTIADNEAPNERRHVVELAQQYLRERNIATDRIFTLSALEYGEARAAGRAPAGWNEVEALRTTLEGHAETHMARLERLAQAKQSFASEPSRAEKPTQPEHKGGFFKRLFGKQ